MKDAKAVVLSLASLTGDAWRLVALKSAPERTLPVQGVSANRCFYVNK